MPDQNDQSPPEQQPVPVTPQRANQQAIIDVAALVESRQADESKFPGGRFLLPSGVYVDADGNPHKDQKSE
jgi:hypothetical protein